MENFINRLNFSSKEHHNSIEIKKWESVNHYERLCLYCAENNIDIKSVSEDDFGAASDLMADFGQSDKSTDSYYFWID